MLGVIRLRGGIGARKQTEDTLRMLGLRKKHTLVILPRTDAILGMIRKAESMITWGELDDEMLNRFGQTKIMHLKPPAKGFRAIKKPYPKGDLGYRGKEINGLVKRMM